MRLTLNTDYALRVLLYLSVRPGERIPTHTIAESYGISLHHLHKVVRALGQLGYLELHRGAAGGIELARDPASIPVGEVVRALEDETALIECFRPDENACVIAPACGLKPALKQAQEAFFAHLDGITVGSLTSGRKAEPLRRLTDAG